VYKLGDENSQPIAVNTLLRAGSPVQFSSVRPGAGAKGEYRWPAPMYDQVVHYHGMPIGPTDCRQQCLWEVAVRWLDGVEPPKR
jgi:hypothetical protein